MNMMTIIGIIIVLLIIFTAFYFLHSNTLSNTIPNNTTNTQITTTIGNSSNIGNNSNNNSSSLSLLNNQKLQFPYAYVLNLNRFGHYNIMVVNTNTNTIAGYINSSSFNNLLDVVFSPDGKYAYITNNIFKDSNTTKNKNSNILVINTSTSSVVKYINSSSFNLMYGIAISPDGKYLYVTNTNYTDAVSANILIINTTTDSVVGAVNTNSLNFNSGVYWLYGIAISPTSGYGYAIDTQNGVIKFNTSTGVPTKPSSLYASFVAGTAFSSNGKYAYVVGQYSGNVLVINTTTSSIIGNISVEIPAKGYSVPQPGPTYIAISPDGSYAYVSEVYNSSISIINTNTNKVVGEIKGLTFPEGVAIHP